MTMWTISSGDLTSVFTTIAQNKFARGGGATFFWLSPTPNNMLWCGVSMRLPQRPCALSSWAGSFYSRRWTPGAVGCTPHLYTEAAELIVCQRLLQYLREIDIYIYMHIYMYTYIHTYRVRDRGKGGGERGRGPLLPFCWRIYIYICIYIYMCYNLFSLGVWE